ncbi:MAG: DUF2752 domain-containing protein [Fimbriimonadales bacterium]|nr:DUF2752 domain-containing protein [Fimbriimonadales bacterium]
MKAVEIVQVSPVDRAARVGHGLIILAVLLLIGLGLYLKPDPSGHGTHQQLRLPPCSIYFFMGRPCPSCGLTTSVSAWLHGDWRLGWRANPFGIVVLLGAAALGINSLMALFTGRGVRIHPLLLNWALILLILAWLIHGVLRFAFW